MEVAKVYRCRECGAMFCEECGDVEARICYDCLGWGEEEEEWEEGWEEEEEEWEEY